MRPLINVVINVATCPNGGGDGHPGKLGMDVAALPDGAGN